MEHYEILVGGHLDQRRTRALGCELIGLLPDGDSVLAFAAVDQAALYGLLGRLRDAGLELVAAERCLRPAPEQISPPDDLARGCPKETKT